MSITFELRYEHAEYNIHHNPFYFMRRFISLMSVFLLTAPLAPITQAEWSYYLVTAYYSPVQWQEFYLHNTYEDEIKMDGEWITTASGKPVTIGAVAAPKDKPFGTRVHITQKITIKGTSYNMDFHGTIVDRGGAIHSASKLPRLDIYMGRGQEGLCRALNFWVQTVYVDFDNNTSIPDTTNLDSIPSTCKNPHNQTVPLASGAKKAFDPFTMSITAGSPAENIKIVQQLLQKAGAYNGSIDGIYGQDMIEAIFQFQKKQWIVAERSDDGAGLYGPKTRTTLKSVLSSEDIASIVITTTNTQTTSNTTTTPTTTTTPSTTTTTTPTTTTTTPQSDSIFGSNVFDGTKAEDIREVQKMLKDLGYFNYEIDGLYNKRIVDAIYAFQLERKIVDNATEQGAGYYGPVTKSTVEEAHRAYLEKKAKIASLEEAIAKVKAEQDKQNESKKQEFVDMVAKIPTLKIGLVHPEIRTLQKILKDGGYMTVKDTAIFGSITKAALIKYQIDLKVIDNANSDFAGVLGEKTRTAMAADLYQKWLKTNSGAQGLEIERLEKELAELKK